MRILLFYYSWGKKSDISSSMAVSVFLIAHSPLL